MTSGEFIPVQASLKRLLTEGSMTGVSESELLDRFFSHLGADAERHSQLRRLESVPHQPGFLIVLRP